MYQSPLRTHGFTLLEMAVVLAIIGILLGGSLTLFTQYTQSLPSRQMAEQMKKIDDALLKFRTTHGRMPCPADITLAYEVANFGQETATPGTCTGVNFTSGNGVAGTLPTKDLGLPDSMAIDPWGSRLLYAVDKRYTNYAGLRRNVRYMSAVTQANPAVVTSTAHDLANGDIVRITSVGGMVELNNNTYQVANVDVLASTFELQTTALTGVDINSTGYTAYTSGGKVEPIGIFRIRDVSDTTFNYAAFVVASMGENRHGAYPKTGGTTRFNAGSTNTMEQANCDCDATGTSGTFDLGFYQLLGTQSTTTGTNNFDDVLLFRTREQLYGVMD